MYEAWPVVCLWLRTHLEFGLSSEERRISALFLESLSSVKKQQLCFIATAKP